MQDKTSIEKCYTIDTGKLPAISPGFTHATTLELQGLDGKGRIRVHSSGKVELIDCSDTDEAARIFWSAVERMGLKLTASVAAPVQLPEPDGFLESHPLGSIYHRGKPSQMQTFCGACPPMYEAGTVRALLAGESAPAAQQTRAWRSGKLTVADLVNNLLMMDQALPIYGAQYIEHPPGKRRAIAVAPTVSRERIKDSRWIGEGESLNAAVIWTRAEQPAPQVTLDYPWRDRLLDGRPLVRDAMGFAEHPELPQLDEGMRAKAFYAALGVEVKHTMADDDLTTDEYDAMCDAENWSNWTPKAPSGEAWNLVAIFDTEDGPAAWWMRELGINQQGVAA